MSKLKDMTNQKIGSLTVIRREGYDKHKRATWLCKCDCGNELIVSGNNLRSGHTKSCGCAKTKVLLERNQEIAKHRMCNSPEYSVWTGMIARCTNPNNTGHSLYGGRGISVCKEWKESFETFYNDMGNRPKGYSIERIDNEKGYSKDNCKWATQTEQSRNTRRNVVNESIVKQIRKLYEVNKLSLTEIANKFNLKRRTVNHITLYNSWKEIA